MAWCRRGLLIGGEWGPADNGVTFAVEDPSTGKVLAEVADASPADGLRALDAAAKAQPAWAARGNAARSCAAVTSCCSRQEELALLMTLEMGKPLAEACGEIAYAAEFFRWFSEEAVRIDGGYAVAPNGQGRLLVMRQPVGPSLLITPWNFPMAMGTRKIGPAVAPGCTMVVKPAEQTANEMVARYRVRTRRWIGSAALVADGLHAFADGFASLTVVLSAAAAWRAFRLPTR